MRNTLVLTAVLVSLTLAGCGVVETTTTITETQTLTIQETTTQVITTTIQVRNLDEELHHRLLADCEAQSNSTEYPDTIENEILSKFLTWTNEGGYYVIVDAETEIFLHQDHAENYRELESMRDWKIEWFSSFGYDISDLYDKFLELNKSSQQLTLKSSVEEGYYVDYDGKFNQYLNELSDEVEWGESFWYTMKIYFPRFAGFYDVSMPAYDPDTGYVLIYDGYQAGAVLGWGRLNLLKYEDGELTEIIYNELWIS